MPLKERIPDDEFDKVVEEHRHVELVRALKKPENNGLEQLNKQTSALLETLVKKNFSTDIGPLETAIKELTVLLKETNRLLQPSPKVFEVERDRLGLIKWVFERETK